jgi:hypothetical protein
MRTSRILAVALAAACSLAPSPGRSQAAWSGTNIGATGIPGSSSFDLASGTFTVDGGGSDIWSSADSFHFLSLPVEGGDFEIVARLASHEAPDDYSKAGLMLRQSLAANAANAMLVSTARKGHWAQHRPASGAGTYQRALGSGAAPVWLKMARSGDYLVGYFSPDGAAWTRCAAERLVLGGTYRAGFAVTSRRSGTISRAVFDSVQVGALPSVAFGALPSGWLARNLASGAGVPGAYAAAEGVVLLTGSGLGATGASDSGAILHRAWHGEGTFVVRVGDGGQISTGAKAGIALRDGTAPGAAAINFYLSGGNKAVLVARAVAGGTTATLASSGALYAPCWLKLERRAGSVAASVSTSGTAWTAVGSAPNTLPSKIDVGLACASGYSAAASTAVFGQVSVTGIDGNENGLLDAWELYHFGNLSQVAGGDPDGDGFANAEEQANGTNPALHDAPAQGAGPAIAVGVEPLMRQGFLERSLWLNIPGSRVSDLLESPAFAGPPYTRDLVAGASAPRNAGSSFGQRLRGTVTAPVTGTYNFWICADDAADLRVGTGESRFSKGLAAWNKTYVAAGSWTSQLSQKSAAVTLQAGQKYWIEALAKDGSGADHLDIGWSYPGQATAVIPSAYLASPALDAADLNDNGLPDAWELAHGVSGGEHGDPDGDGLTNFEEYRYGTHPSVAGGVPGHLARDVWTGIGGLYVPALTGSPVFLDEPWLHELWAGASFNPGATLLDSFGQRFRGTVTAPVTGYYTFWVAGDNGTELWLSDDARKFRKRRIARSESYQAYGNFDALVSQRSASIPLVAGREYYIEILHKEHSGGEHVAAAWSVAGAPREIIPAGALKSYARDPDDRDDDDLPDSWEAQFGLDPSDNGLSDARQASYGDFDADGLTNREEYLGGSDPCRADTFGNGIGDGSRTFLPGAYALPDAAFIGVPLVELGGAAYSGTSANWYDADGTSLVSTSRRGTVEYRFSMPTAGSGLLQIRGAARGATSGTVELPVRLTLDGASLGTVVLRSVGGGPAEVLGVLPNLAAGEHLLRLESLNVRDAYSLQVDGVSVRAVAGPDGDGDGLPDWLESQIAAENGFDAAQPGSSRTSPVCVEGLAKFPGMVAVAWATGTRAASAGPDHLWYADVPLDPAGPVAVEAAFENGAKRETRLFEWAPTNVIAETSSTLALRRGDSLRLTAFPGAQATGTAAFVVRSGTAAVAEFAAPADDPAVYRLDVAGTFSVVGTHGDGGAATSGTLVLEVRSADFGPEFPVYAGRERAWELPGVAADLPLEADSGLSVASGTSAAFRSLKVSAPAIGGYPVIARPAADGPVLASGTVRVFGVASSNETGDVQVVYDYGSGDQLVRMGVVVDDLPPGGYVELRIYAPGVTFQDGTSTTRLYGSAFDPNGIAYVVFNYPSDVETSVCHSLLVFDANGTLINLR